MRGSVLLFLIVCTLTSCIDDLTGSLGASNDIKDAKKRGVFVKEYTTHPNPYHINDTLQITVKEAWLEHQWRHKKFDIGAKIEDEGYQLCVNTIEKDLNGFDFKWSIGINVDRYLHGCSRNSLAGDFKKITGDTIDFPVQKGEFSFDTTGVKIIGHFVLVKK